MNVRTATHIIERPRLADRLDAALASGVLLLQAPPGFGKTVSLTSALARTARRSVYVSLRPSTDALRDLCATLAQTLADALGIPAPSFGKSSAPPGVEEFARWMRTTLGEKYSILALDDVHHINADDRAVAWLMEIIRATSPWLAWALASRSAPAAALAAWRDTGALSDFITETDLAFDDRELEAVIEQRISVSRAQTKALVQETLSLTQGWPAATTLALHCRSSSMADPVQGAQDLLYQYLAQQSFRALDPSARQFLLDTCLVPTLGATAAIALAGAGGDVTLQRLKDSLPFISESAGTFRYHDLYRDFLVHTLRSAGEAAHAAALARCGEWLVRQPNLADASLGVEMLLEADALGPLGAAIETLWARLGARGYAELLARALVRLDALDPVVRGAAETCIAAFLHRDADDARARASETLARIPEHVRPLDVAVLAGMFDVVADIGDSSVHARYGAACARHLHALDTRGGMLDADDARLAAHYVTGVNRRLHAGEPALALALLEQLAQNVEAPAALRLQAMLDLAQAAYLLTDASLVHYIDDAKALADAESLPLPPEYHATLAFVEIIFRSRQRRALGACADWFDLAKRLGDARAERDSLLLTFSLEMRVGDLAEAARARRALDRFRDESQESIFALQLRGFDAQLTAYHGQFREAAAILLGRASARPEPALGLGNRLAAVLYMALGDQMPQAAQELARLLPELEPLQSMHPAVRFQAHALAICNCLLVGKRELARSLLDRTLQGAEQLSIWQQQQLHAVRLLVRTETSDSDWESALQAMRDAQLSGPALLLGYVRGHLRSPKLRLTKQEINVLLLVAEGLSSVEIASRNGRKAETVNAQVKSICRKLGVSGRREALVAARERCLI